MTDVEKLIIENMAIWALARHKKNGSGRGNGKKVELVGIKKLRELILELAVRGKLVPQDPEDEPAGVLLERIAAEKTQLIKDGKIKRQKVLPDVGEGESLFDLPKGWACARLGNITCKLGSGSTPRGGKSAYVESGIPFLRSQNIWNDGLKLLDIAFIPDEVHQKMDNTKVIPGDVLLNITGASLGRSTIFPEELIEANVSQHVTIIRLVEKQMGRFVHLGILSPMVQRLVWGRQVGMAIEGLSKKVLEMFEFPIPPLAEQHRIVAKVNELMSLCDQLEQQAEASLTAHAVLVENLLKVLVNSADAEELKANWNRMAEHFTTLFTTEESIDQLKATILQLGVMGRLVPQDPNDEPASELLKRIADEKARLVKEKKIKRQKALPEITEEEKPFDLPEGWVLIRLGDIGCILGGGTPNKSNSTLWGGSIPWVSPKDMKNDYIENVKDTITEEAFQCSSVKLIPKKSLLLVVRGMILAHSFPVAINVVPVAINQDMKAIVFSGFVESYLLILMKSLKTEFVSSVDRSSHGTCKLVSEKLLSKVLILPPLSEQYRIVAKVNQLMTVCDTLKDQIAETATTRVQLAEALVAQAVG